MNPFIHLSSLKAAILRAFGAKVGSNVEIKPRINIKYPWHLRIGDNSWIGEEVWIDSLTTIDIGSNVCVSQGAYLCCGNHDWKAEAFDLIVSDICIQDGAWIGAKSIILPGAKIGTHSVIAAGAVFSGESEPSAIYTGNPASLTGKRELGGQHQAGFESDQAST